MIDHYLLSGVPNTAFTEAIAFVFQAHDLDLLGITSNDPQAETMKTLNDFWMTYEIAGVGLVDMGVGIGCTIIPMRLRHSSKKRHRDRQRYLE